MTDEERKQEPAEEEVEDLDAPAEAQDDVVGGADKVPIPVGYDLHRFKSDR